MHVLSVTCFFSEIGSRGYTQHESVFMVVCFLIMSVEIKGFWNSSFCDEGNNTYQIYWYGLRIWLYFHWRQWQNPTDFKEEKKALNNDNGPLDYKLVLSTSVSSIWLHNGYINVCVYTKITTAKSQNNSSFQYKALLDWRSIIIKKVKILLDVSLYFLSCFVFGWKIGVLLM